MQERPEVKKAFKKFLENYVNTLESSNYLDKPAAKTLLAELKKNANIDDLSAFIQKAISASSMYDEDKVFVTIQLNSILDNVSRSQYESVAELKKDTEKLLIRIKSREIKSRNATPVCKPFFEYLLNVAYYIYNKKKGELKTTEVEAVNNVLRTLAKSYQAYVGANGLATELDGGQKKFQEEFNHFIGLMIVDKERASQMQKLILSCYKLELKKAVENIHDFVVKQLGITDDPATRVLSLAAPRDVLTALPRDVFMERIVQDYLPASSISVLSQVNRALRDRLQPIQMADRRRWERIKDPMSLVVKADVVLWQRGHDLILSEEERQNYESITRDFDCVFWPRGKSRELGCSRMEAFFLNQFQSADHSIPRAILDRFPTSNWMLFAIHHGFTQLIERCEKVDVKYSVSNEEYIPFLESLTRLPQESAKKALSQMHADSVYVDRKSCHEELFISKKYKVLKKFLALLGKNSKFYRDVFHVFFDSCHTPEELKERYTQMELQPFPVEITVLVLFLLFKSELSERELRDKLYFLIEHTGPVEDIFGSMIISATIFLKDPVLLEILLRDKDYAKAINSECTKHEGVERLAPGFDKYYLLHFALYCDAGTDIMDILKRYGAREDVTCCNIVPQGLGMFQDEKRVDVTSMEAFKAQLIERYPENKTVLGKP